MSALLFTVGGMSTMSSLPGERQAQRFGGELAADVRAGRQRRAWTLAELGDRAGLSRSHVHSVESGEAASVRTYGALAAALGLRLECRLVDPRLRDRARASRAEDPVHAAMGEAEAAHLRGLGYQVALDEPYQHYQFAGRADLLAWSIEHRALLHIENRTRFVNLGETFGSYNSKRAYLADEIVGRLGVHRFVTVTHVMIALWSADVLHALRLRGASFRAVCPDPTEPFARWWTGGGLSPGTGSTVVVLDPIGYGRSDRRRFIGLDEAGTAKPRYRGYGDAADALARGV